jgi:BolA protein
MDRTASIEARLREAFAPVHLAITDDSHRHAGHAGSSGGTHVTVTVVSEAFEGHSAVDRQRLVYALFAEEMRSGAIHAMALTTRTPAEWARR